MFFFLQIQVGDNSASRILVYQQHFSNCICSFSVPVSHFSGSCTVSSVFITVVFVTVICDL